MRPDNNIQKLIENLKTNASSGLDAKVHTAIDDALAERERIESAYGFDKLTINKPTLGRIIMKSPITKLAAAACIIIAVVAGIYFLTGKTPSVTCCAWADIIRPIMDANTAEFDIIVGEEGEAPLIHDMIMGSKIRRTMEGIEEVSVIDLGTMRILTLETEKKEAVYIDLKGLPQMPNYLDQLKGVIKLLQNTPHFEVEQLGQQEIDGQILYGFKAKHPQVNIVIYVDPATALPVRIEQEGGQMKVICKNMRFDVPMDETQFSMEAPEGYKVESQELDLFGSTEKDFIEGLRVQAEVLNDGVFPDDVSIEYTVKTAADLKDKFNKLKMPDDEKTALGMKYSKGLMFIRFFKGEGKWHYAGKGVKLGDANTAIFWYRPAGSSTYHVIYGDLSVEDVNKEDLPQPVEEVQAPPFTGVQDDKWHITSSGQIEGHCNLLIKKKPADTTVMPVVLPYNDAVLVSAKSNDVMLAFNKTAPGRYEVTIPLEKINGDKVEFVWTMPISSLQKIQEMFEAKLGGLIPVSSYKLTVILDEGCGYVFSEDPSKREFVPFSWNSQETKDYFGSCGIPIKPSNEQ